MSRLNKAQTKRGISIGVIDLCMLAENIFLFSTNKAMKRLTSVKLQYNEIQDKKYVPFV